MREDTKKTNVYTFDELSDRAKERARDWYREAVAHDFADWDAEYVIEDAARMADMLGIRLRTRPTPLMNGKTRMDADVYWAVAARDAGASYSGSYSYKTGSARAIAAEAPSAWTNRETGERREDKHNAELNRIATELADVQRRNFYQLQASIGHGRSRDSHSSSMSIDVERADGHALNHSDDDETVAQLLRDFADWIHSQLEREWEYRNSDECVDENITANEYEFTEDGDRYV